MNLLNGKFHSQATLYVQYINGTVSDEEENSTRSRSFVYLEKKVTFQDIRMPMYVTLFSGSETTYSQYTCIFMLQVSYLY